MDRKSTHEHGDDEDQWTSELLWSDILKARNTAEPNGEFSNCTVKEKKITYSTWKKADFGEMLGFEESMKQAGI